jgi:hypothetical protein
MWHEVVLGREFFARLLAIDAAVASRTQAAGCGYCEGPLCVGHYERKPRGGLVAMAGEEDLFTLRFSYCCGREGCRRRVTPPSVRFLGRKVYVEGAVLIACAVAAVDDRARAIRAATGVAARTVRRWHAWWRTVFASSALWVEVRSRAPTLEIATLPGGMLSLFEGATAEEKLVRAMQFLGPLTSATAARRSRSSRDAM